MVLATNEEEYLENYEAYEIEEFDHYQRKKI
jgi:hypothetical protein